MILATAETIVLYAFFVPLAVGIVLYVLGLAFNICAGLSKPLTTPTIDPADAIEAELRGILRRDVYKKSLDNGNLQG